MKKLTLVGVLAVLCLYLPAQQPALKPLSIGDTVPDVAINNILNYKGTAARLSDFKRELVILDFMNTYCLSCIAALPRFDSLQHQYGDKLQIFIVTNEAKDRVKKFLKINPVARNISMPVVVEDTALERLFPHRFVSHEAWINKGIVKAITGSEYVKEQNILTVLSGETPVWEVKNDNGDYDFDAPLLTLNDDTRKYVAKGNTYGSVCIPHLKGVGVFYKDDVDSNTCIRSIRAINYSIAALYMQALTDWKSFTRSHVLLQPGKEQYFAYINKKEYYNVWNEKNSYCYEASFPPLTPEPAIRQKIQADLDMYLQVQSSFETRKTSCYVLLPDSGFTASSFPTGDYAKLVSQASKDDVVFMSPDDLITTLNRNYWGTPFYNGIDKRLHIPVILPEAVLTDIQILKTALKQQHLLLQKVTKDVDMLVLKQKQNKSFTKSQN